MHKALLKFINLIVIIVLIISSLPNIVVLADEEKKNEKEVIRVGYMENYGVLKSPMVNGYEGYGYEYLRKIEEYIDYEFEFVLCNWSDIIDMLRNGEVDVITPFRKNDERIEEFYFSEHNFAREIMLIFSNDIISLDENSYHLLNDETIAVREGSAAYPYLLEFIEEYNLSPEIYNVQTDNFLEDIRTGDYNYFLTGSLQMETDLNIAVSFGSTQTYFMSTSQEIVDKLDYAMTQIDDLEFLYQEELQTKYFHHNIGSNIYISQQEFDLMQSTPIYNVGVINMYPSFGYNYQKEIHNISVDVLEFIEDKLSININLIEINATTTKEELDELDFYIHLSGYDTDIYSNKSIPYMTDTLLLVQNENENLNSNTTVGVLEYYNLDNEFVTSLTYKENVAYYSDVRSLINAFNNGNVSSIVVADSLYELLYVLIETTSHKTKNLFYPILPTIVYTDNFPSEKIQIIDKAISYITEEDAKKMLLHNQSLIASLERRLMYTRYGYTFLIFFIVIYVIVRISKRNKQKEIDRVANYDRLTQLYTQPKFIKETQNLLNSNSNNKYTLYSFDIDNFKYMNELYGFDVGDEILRSIGNFLRDTLPKEYPISRISSDYFILLVKSDDNIKSNELITKTGHHLRNKLNDLIGNSYNIEYSVGCYEIDDKSIDIERMIDYCNLARSYSKDELGTVVTVYSDLMNEKEAIRNDIVFRMNKALKDKEFVLYYQPKFDIITQKIVGAEALVRWFSSDQMMPPNDFIPLFEKNGFIEKLDYHVIDTACKFILDNSDVDIPIISINLSSVTLMKNDVIEKILYIVNKHSIKPNQVELEVTESAFVDQFDVALQRIDDLRSKGFTISMDDFGTGVSSLGRLKNMEIDVLKIDREFIMETLQNSKSDVILESVIKMASKLDLETIAEGIETEEQLGFLRDSGCDVGQGFYFARPLPEQEFLKLLKNQK